jgi:hypothetical protein
MDAASFVYFNIIGDRASLAIQEDAGEDVWLDAANMVLSLETAKQNNAVPADFFRSNFLLFHRYVNFLPPTSKDMLLAYHLFGTPQATLGRLFAWTQTEVSKHLTMTERLLGWYILNAGYASPGKIDYYLAKANVEGLREAYAYVVSGETKLAGQRKILVTKTYKKLADSNDPELRAFGAYLWSLRDAMTNRWKEKREERQQELKLVDPDYLGEFRMKLPIPKMFMGRSDEWSGHED